MSSPVPDSATRPASALKPRQVYIKGLIMARRKISTQDGPKFLTLMKLAAPDAYSSPATIEVESLQALGAKDEEFSGIFELRGYARTFDTRTDDGEKIKVTTATNVLSFVG